MILLQWPNFFANMKMPPSCFITLNFINYNITNKISYLFQLYVFLTLNKNKYTNSVVKLRNDSLKHL